MKLLNNEYCTITLESDTPCLLWKLKGKVRNDVFEEHVSIGLDLFRMFKEDYVNLSLIVDLFEFNPSEEINIQWVNEEIMTLLYFNNGIKLISLIYPYEGEIAKRTAFEFFEKTEQLHRIEILDSIEQSKLWLQNNLRTIDQIGDTKVFF